MSNNVPRGERMVITLVGRRNVGKSSLVNAVTGQEISIVADHPGTTTDPVTRHYELLPLGPVTFYDTAGLDDTGDLGEQRIRATLGVLYRTDIAVLVVGEEGVGEVERSILERVQSMGISVVVVFNKTDTCTPAEEDTGFCDARGGPPEGVRPFGTGDSIPQGQADCSGSP